MDLTTVETFITTFGFPVALVIAIDWYEIDNPTEEQTT